jgi:hypothetical protein
LICLFAVYLHFCKIKNRGSTELYRPVQWFRSIAPAIRDNPQRNNQLMARRLHEEFDEASLPSFEDAPLLFLNRLVEKDFGGTTGKLAGIVTSYLDPYWTITYTDGDTVTACQSNAYYSLFFNLSQEEIDLDEFRTIVISLGLTRFLWGLVGL